MAIEEHGAGKQLVRLRAWLRYSRGRGEDSAVLCAVRRSSARSRLGASAILGTVAETLIVRTLCECADAMGAILRSIKRCDNIVTGLDL